MPEHEPKTLDDARLRTLAVHAGHPGSDGVVAPIHRSSTYRLGEPESFDDIRYIRLNNTPTQLEAEAAIGALEHGKALLTPSGTAAVHLALSLFEPGDHLIVPERLYGGTRKLLDYHAARVGLTMTYVDMQRPELWADAMQDRTRGIFVESIANPWMSVPDLRAVTHFARAHDLTSMVDNTLATPVVFQPRSFGFDVVVHSASKHINGHSDVVAGVVIADEARAKSLRLIANKLGICPDPQACFLIRRGIKTLPLRVRAQCESAMALATFFDEHEGVEAVFYPAFDEVSRANAEAAFRNGLYGTMLAFMPKGGERAARKLIESLEIATEAPSLGGVETLITRPCTTSHAGLTPEYRASIGIDDAMVRLSVGIEGTSDLRADFERALAGC